METKEFNFKGKSAFYRGKVRDVYSLNDGRLVMVASDRISAFDHILPRTIPYKGQVLNQIAAYFLTKTSDIVPNWFLTSPDPSVTVGIACEPIRVEMVIRGYLSGHAARTYQSGERVLCGVTMPEGMQENDRFPEPIITPAVKAEEGHDEDISREDILNNNLVSEEIYLQMEDYTRKLFQRGTEMAAAQGLILVDTKYEFGLHEGKVVLMDEIHTPDSSRYFYLDGYEERQHKRETQQQLSKEFVRQWLIQQGFQGLEGQTMPLMNDAMVDNVSKRYIALYEQLTGQAFVPGDYSNLEERIQNAVDQYLLLP
ncbi:MAG: phosphoribosylaminoimidazolesuccinocarboxamide synthase [Bacteroidota bacterium]